MHHPTNGAALAAPVSHLRLAHSMGCALDNPAVHYLLGLSSGSRRTQTYALRIAAKVFGAELGAVDWASITPGQMVALRSFVAEQYSYATANRILAAVRGTMLICVQLGRMTRDHFELCRVKSVRGRRTPAGRALVPEEIEALFRACNGTRGPLGRRHAATLALCYGCGLRRAEATALPVEAYDRGRRMLRVLGKGDVERFVPLPDGSVRALEWWLEARGDAPGFLLCHVSGRSEDAGIAPALPMNESAIYTLLQVLARRARVAHVSPHDLRRTYIGDVLDSGADLATAQSLVGHADPETTARYDRRGLRPLAEAAARLVVPFSAE